MDQVQEINKCIDHCKQVIMDLKALSGNTNNQVLKSTLDESAHRLEMCLLECEYAQARYHKKYDISY